MLYDLLVECAADQSGGGVGAVEEWRSPEWDTPLESFQIKICWEATAKHLRIINNPFSNSIWIIFDVKTILAEYCGPVFRIFNRKKIGRVWNFSEKKMGQRLGSHTYIYVYLWQASVDEGISFDTVHSSFHPPESFHKGLP